MGFGASIGSELHPASGFLNTASSSLQPCASGSKDLKEILFVVHQISFSSLEISQGFSKICAHTPNISKL
jgi:hypothetical protein